MLSVRFSIENINRMFFDHSVYTHNAGEVDLQLEFPSLIHLEKMSNLNESTFTFIHQPFEIFFAKLFKTGRPSEFWGRFFEGTISDKPMKFWVDFQTVASKLL